VAGLLALGALAVGGWLIAHRAQPGGDRDAGADLGGYTTALATLALLSVVVFLVNSFSLVLVLPSLYAWLFLTQASRWWTRVALYLAGFAGPVAVVAVLAERFDLGADVSLYLLGLAATGSLPTTTAVGVLAWCAIAAQVGAVTFGRYRPVEARRAHPRGATAQSSGT
jgi:hypothetical protein